ncbi:MAG: TonB-dependent receptor, partial [Novosphingobium sp.]
MNSVNYDRRHAQEDLWQVRADYTQPVAIGDDSAIKIGAKYLDRHKTNDRAYQQYSLASGKTFTAANASYTGDTSFYDGAYTFGPRIDYNAAQAYAVANGVLTQSASNLTSSLNNSLVNDYDVREKIWAGYAMATLNWGALTVIPGVRVEHTQDDTKAKVINSSATVNDGYNSFGHKSYTNVTPGVNVKYEPQKDLIVRFAATTSIARPNYPDLAPYVSVDTTTSPTTITLGNPDLKPYKALNLDAAVEFYLPNKGVISVGAFYKHLDDPIYSQTVSVTNYTVAGQTFSSASLVQPLNVDKAEIYGVEFNLVYQFDFLPAPLDGLGVSGNLTLVDGHGEGSANRSGQFPLFYQSKTVGNAALTYEKYGV